MTDYIVYTEILEDGGVQRWYYGTYYDANTANEVALALGANFPVFHCVCLATQADALGIQNLPWC